MPRKGRGVHAREAGGAGLCAMSPGQGQLQLGEEAPCCTLDADQGPQAAKNWGGRSVEGVGGTGEGGGGGGHGGVGESVRGTRTTQRQPRWADCDDRVPDPHPGASGGDDGGGGGSQEVEEEDGDE